MKNDNSKEIELKDLIILKKLVSPILNRKILNNIMLVERTSEHRIYEKYDDDLISRYTIENDENKIYVDNVNTHKVFDVDRLVELDVERNIFNINNNDKTDDLHVFVTRDVIRFMFDNTKLIDKLNISYNENKYYLDESKYKNEFKFEFINKNNKVLSKIN